MLANLPLEILFEIAKSAHFSRAELLAYRLICRRLCAVFTPYAFHTVRTNNFDRVSFDRLCSIAQTPHLAEHVVEYEYRLVPILEPLSHHEVDILLPSLSLAEPRAPSGKDGQPTGIPCDDPSEAMDIIAYTQNLHKNHQKYLRQQDVLGTFYDTLSILQSLPLFNRLQTIRILDFEVPPKEYDNEDPTNTEAYNTAHITAVVRATYSIAKTLRFLRVSALPELRCWEIERFDYQVFNSHINPPICQYDEVEEQFHLALCRVSIFKIHKLTSGKAENDIPLCFAPYSLVDELMQGDLALEELTLSDGRGTDVPRHYRYQGVTFPWGSRAYGIGRIDYSGIEGCLFPKLRKLDLSGHRSLDLLNFAGMLCSLTPGILKELALEALGMHNGQWEDLFRIIAPKKKWGKKNRIWPGEHIHATVQSFFSDSKWVQADVVGLKGLVDNRRILDGDGAQRLPKAGRKLLWKGLQLEKCQLKHLCYWGSIITANGFQRFPLSARQEETFRRWMMDGLDEEQYDALFLPWHVW